MSGGGDLGGLGGGGGGGGGKGGGGGGDTAGLDSSMGMGNSPDMTGLGGPGGDMAFGGPPGFDFPGGGNVTTPSPSNPENDPNIGAPASQAPTPGQSPTSIGGVQSGGEQSPLQKLFAQASPLEAAAAQGQSFAGGQPGTSTGLQETIPPGTATELQQQQAGGAQRFAPAGAREQETQQQQTAAGGAQRFAPQGARPDVGAQQQAAGQAERYSPTGPGQEQEPPPPPAEPPKTDDTGATPPATTPPATTPPATTPPSTGPVSSRGTGAPTPSGPGGGMEAPQGVNPMKLIGDALRGILTGDFSGLSQDLQGLSGQPGAQPDPGGYGPPGPSRPPTTTGPTSTGTAQPPAVGSQAMNSLPGAPDGQEPAADDAQGQRRKEWYQTHDRASPFPEDQFPERQGPTKEGGVLPSYSGQPQTGDQPIAPAQTRFNLMHGQYGRPGQNIGSFSSSAGNFQANNAAGPHFAGFLNDLTAAGAPGVKNIGGFNIRNIAGTNNISQHSYGNAIDVDQTSYPVRGNKGDNPPLRQWIQSHPQQYAAIANKWGISNGGDFGDWGHFEWNGGGVGAGTRTAGQGQPAAATPGATGNMQRAQPTNPSGRTRGDRNLNPGNIKGGPYPGQVGRDDQGHAIFRTPEDGARAQASLLRTKYNNETVPQMARYANGNQEWVRNVMRFGGFGPNDRLDLNNPATLDRLQKAIWRAEGTRLPVGRQPSAAEPQASQPARTRGQDLIGGPRMGSAADFLQDQGFDMTG